MATSATPQTTDFTRDVFGRYVCNGLDEAQHSADPTVVRLDGRAQIEARPFDLIVIGGGTFGAAVAEPDAGLHGGAAGQAEHGDLLIVRHRLS